MREPIAFVYGNCVLAQGLDDRWAAFAVQVSSYAWLSEEAKRARFLALIGALEAIEADVQIVRVCRRWEAERYTGQLREQNNACGADATRARVYEAYVDEHARRVGDGSDVGTAEAVLFLIVSLREPERDVASYVSRAAGQHPKQWWTELRRTLAQRDSRMLECVRARADARSSRPGARPPRGFPARARSRVASSCSGWCAGPSAEGWVSP